MTATPPTTRWIYVTDLSGEPLPGYDPFAPVALWDSDSADLSRLISLVLTSLYTDRLADASDQISDLVSRPHPDRRGWWADTPTDRLGSRLWLLMRAPLAGDRGQDTTDRAADYIREALAWMIDDGLIASVDVQTEIRSGGDPGGSGQTLAAEVTLIRGDGTGVTLTWPDLWPSDIGDT